MNTVLLQKHSTPGGNQGLKYQKGATTMITLPQTNMPVKPPPEPTRFQRNFRAVLAAGYNARISNAAIHVNGVVVDRAYFEELHPLNLLALLDKHIGRPGSREV